MKKRIDVILVEQNIAENRSKARAMILAGQVSIDGKLAKKSGELYKSDSKLNVKNLNPKWSSRGAIKLIHAIKYFNFYIENLTCLDIGASTGGFTDVLLNYKAKKIFAVDVGTNQLHEKLKKEEKIINLEKTNARYLNKDIINEPIDLIVCDVSFISLKKVIEPALNLLKKPYGKIIVLIKPQFESSKNEIEKGGIITNSLVHDRICNEIKIWFKNHELKVLGLTKSPIKGPKGNIEFFIAAEN